MTAGEAAVAPYGVDSASEGPSLGPSRSWRELPSLIWEPQLEAMARRGWGGGGGV